MLSPFASTGLHQLIQLVADQPLLQQLLLALPVLLLSTMLPVPASYQPLTVFRLLATALAKKVNKTDNSHQQQLLSGTLALLLLLLPPLAISVAVERLSQWPQVWQALVLYVCLDWQLVRQQVAAVQQSLQKQQLDLARHLLQPLVLRQCRQLSVVGVSKAAIETLWLRLAKQWLTVLLLFILFGTTTALAYRLVLELQQSWNVKLDSGRRFGTPAALWVAFCSALPVMLCGTLLALMVNWRQSCQYLKFSQDGFFAWPQRWLLSAVSAAVQRNLAGPVYYSTEKQRRVRIGPAAEPQPADITVALRLCRQLQQGCFLLSVCAAVLLLVAIAPY